MIAHKNMLMIGHFLMSMMILLIQATMEMMLVEIQNGLAMLVWLVMHFLESPGNPFDGIDNDGDYELGIGGGIASMFEEESFDSTLINVGDKVILINDNYERSQFTIPNQTTVEIETLGKTITINPGTTQLVEGNVSLILKAMR